MEIAEYNLHQNDSICGIARQLHGLDLTPADHLPLARLRLLNSQLQHSSSVSTFKKRRQELANYIGLNENIEFMVSVPSEVPGPSIPVDSAVSNFKKYNPNDISRSVAFLQRDMNLTEAKRSGFNIDLSVSFGLTSQATAFKQSYTDLLDRHQINVSFSLPLLDWKRNGFRQKIIASAFDASLAELEDNQTSSLANLRIAIDHLTESLNQLKISSDAEILSGEIYKKALKRYSLGKEDLSYVAVALAEKNNAERNRINLILDYWRAYFTIRRLTLYDYQLDRPLAE
jgi:outer membrane protein TolC